MQVVSWNRAILTPAGIQKRVFDLKEDAPIEVMVPIDAIAPFQVIHDGFNVTVHSSRFVIGLSNFTFESLFQAQTFAKNALSSLPETPCFGAGMNIGFTCNESVSELDELLTVSECDDKLADHQLRVAGRSFGRQLYWKNGKVNLSVGRDENNIRRISLNVERTSTSQDDLIGWLETSAEDVHHLVKMVLTEALELDLKIDGKKEDN